MPAIASMKTSSILAPTVLTTSATVGVDKTWDPEGFISPGVARWVDRSGGVPDLYPYLTMSSRKPTNGSQVYKVQVKVALPTPNTVGNAYNGITPGPSKAYEVAAQMEFFLPIRSTSAERAAMFSHLHSLFATTITANDAVPSDLTVSPLVAMVTNLDAMWG